MATPPRLEPFDGALHLSPGCVLYVGPGGAADSHAHHAVQLVVAPDAPVSLVIGGLPTDVHVALIPAGVPHALDAAGRRVAIALFERHGPQGRALDVVARRGPTEAQRAALRALPFPGREAPLLAAAAWTQVLAGDLRRSPVTRPVRTAIDELARCMAAGDAPRLDRAARAAGMSPSRLTHRFTAEVGIPLRAFVPWLRVARAVAEVQRDRAEGLAPNLTRAALAAGFVDSGHLTRSFKALFGLPPSLVLSRTTLHGFDVEVA
jgi:AraC-like DNA-binding protein